MPDAETFVTYLVPAILFVGGIVAVFYVRHVTRKEMAERDARPPAE